MTLPPPLRGCRAAFIFMTRLRVGGFPFSPQDFHWAPAYFPLVGLFVGTWGALVFVLASSLGAPVASALAVVATVWITGAFHEDGLADTADALGGSPDRKKLHEILKDSRLGTYGCAALSLSLLLRILFLVELDTASLIDLSKGLSAPVALPVVHLLARTGPVAIMALLPYVTDEGAKSTGLVAADCRLQAVCAGLWGGLVLAALFSIGSPVSLVVSLAIAVTICTAMAARWFRMRAGGYTGDFLGATEQILELLLLLVLLAHQQHTEDGGLWPVWY